MKMVPPHGAQFFFTFSEVTFVNMPYLHEHFGSKKKNLKKAPEMIVAGHFFTPPIRTWDRREVKMNQQHITKVRFCVQEINFSQGKPWFLNTSTNKKYEKKKRTSTQKYVVSCPLRLTKHWLSFLKSPYFWKPPTKCSHQRHSDRGYRQRDCVHRHTDRCSEQSLPFADRHPGDRFPLRLALPTHNRRQTRDGSKIARDRMSIVLRARKRGSASRGVFNDGILQKEPLHVPSACLAYTFSADISP